MDIHEDVMPKAEEINGINKQLKSQFETATELEKELLQEEIDRFDSVSIMIDWMHEFKSLPDTTNEEKVREYYEAHLEKAKKFREAILAAVNKDKN